MPRIDRRQFHRALGVGTVAATIPAFLQKTTASITAEKQRNDRVLVVIQLGGGNDGLNTVVPFRDDRYYKARPKIALDSKTLLKVSDDLALHPELLELHKLYQNGALAIIPNVGYPNPNRSHFRSTDIWESASPADKLWKTGWLGRYFDQNCSEVKSSTLGIRIGEQPSLAFAAEQLRASTFANPKMLLNPATGAQAQAMQVMSEVQPTGIAALDFVQRTQNETLTLSRQLQLAVKDVKSAVDYPPFALCQSLRLVCQMITAGLPTRVYYVSHGGFDTHAAQTQKQAYLLQELSQAVSLFHQDLKAHGQLDRVLGITFSEFGRRVAENKQAGTDHGAASIMFAFGGKVKPGLHGNVPDLENLDPLGDLAFKTDFREVYAGVLQHWFAANPEKILQGKFQPLNLLS
jgi:uncharacterized protein (DUF1501 family)